MVSIKHKKVVTIPDDPVAAAAGLVVSSDWNNTLDFKADATAIILGRKTAGVGDIEELTAGDTRTMLGLVPGTAAGNIAQLDLGGKLDVSVLPALAITETFVVASQATMLALSAQMGDFAIRSDINKTFVLSTNSPSTLADWKEILVPGAPVSSIDSQTGNPTIGGITAAATSKATIVDADKLPISDSAASNGTKHLTWANLKAGLWSALGALIAAGTAKTTPVDADVFAIGDSAASNATKKTTLANIKAVLKTYFDTLYQAAGSSSSVPTMIVWDERATGTGGGTSAGSTWNNRVLNTVGVNTITGASLASDQITLPAGTYDLYATAPSLNAGVNKLRLRNVTDATVAVAGSNAQGISGGMSQALMVGRFTISASKVVSLQHYIASGRGVDDALGVPTSAASTSEIYSVVVIRKVS